MINNDKIFSSENYNLKDEQSQEGIKQIFVGIGIFYLALFILSKIQNKIKKHNETKVKQFAKDNKLKLEKLKKFVDSCLLEFNEICKYIENNCEQIDYDKLLNYDDIISPFEKIISKNKNINNSIIPYLNKHAKKISLYPQFYDHNSIDYDGKEFKDLMNIRLPKFTKELCNKKYKYFKIISNEKEIIDNICDGGSIIEIKVDYSNLDISLLSDFIDKD